MERLSAGFDLEAISSIGGAQILRGDPRRLVYRLAPLASAGPDDLSFLSDGRYLTQARATRAGAVIARAADAEALPPACAVLACEDPYRAFAAVARQMAARLAPAPIGGRAGSAVVADDAQVGEHVWIGPHVVVGPGAVIGDGAVLETGVVLGPRVAVGAGSMLYPRVTIYSDCTLGARCIVHAGAVIGADGFGFAPAGGDWEKIPQLGAVMIGNDVEIGANTTIDRGTLDDTVIGDGCKLDNQIQIGHNVRIGEGSALAGCVGVAGSATIGRRCRIGGGAGILGHLEICDDVTVSAMSLVTRSIRKPGFYSGVFPLMDNADWQRSAALLRRLPELRARLRSLERPDDRETR